MTRPGRIAALVVALGGIAVGWSPVVGTDEPGGRPDDRAQPARQVIEGVTHGSRWLVDIQTGSATPLPLSLRPVFATGYAVSPNGRRVAFTAPDPDGDLGSSRLFLATTDGTRVRPITPTGVRVWHPAWSRDGRRIVYVDEEGLAVLHLGSGRVRRFARVSPRWIARPGFRPDGRAVLFTRTAGDPVWDALWSVPARGGRPRLVVRQAASGAWSPDGERIAFLRFRSGEATCNDGSPFGCFFAVPPASRLALVDPDGRRVRLVRGTRVSGLGPTDDPSDRRPVWAPDSRHVALDMRGRIVIVGLGAGRVRHLACGRRPVWWDRGHVLVESFDGDCDGTVDVPQA